MIGCMIRLALILMVAGWLFGCSTPGIPTYQRQLERNQAIQDCVLSGGHPHLGPADTIICD